MLGWLLSMKPKVYFMKKKKLQGPVEFNSNGSRDARVIRVQQYHVAGKQLHHKRMACTTSLQRVVLWRYSLQLM